MILGIDPGLAACGWAVVQRDGRVLALGVITSSPDRVIAKSTDRARRTRSTVADLADLVTRHGVQAIASEAALTFGHVGAASAQNLAWGAVIALAHLRGLELVEVVAKEWQRAVVPSSLRKVDYTQVKAALARYVGDQVDQVPRALQTHALDAVGVAVYAALRPTRRVA